MTERRGASFRALRAIRQFGRGTTAGPIVEFAIIVPVLVLMIVGIVDVSLAFVDRSGLVSAVRSGARSAAVMPPGTLCSQAGEDAVKAVVVAEYNRVRLVRSVENLLAANQVTVTRGNLCESPMGADRHITVEVNNFAFASITPLFRILGSSGIQLRARATYRSEYAPE